MQTEISSLRKQSMMILVTLLQNDCSSSEQSSPSSGCLRTSCLRVSSLTQLFILLRFMVWQRQKRLTLHSCCVGSLPISFYTILLDFPFFWINDKMSLMMLGTTFLFYSCCDFFDFLETQVSGWQSSSLEVFFSFETQRPFFLLSWSKRIYLADSSQFLRSMVCEMACWRQIEFYSPVLSQTFWKVSVGGINQAGVLGSRKEGQMMQYCVR